jgi:hypothetical protein
MGPMLGQPIQVDVKFLKFNRPDGKKVKHFQYTVEDNATCNGPLKSTDVILRKMLSILSTTLLINFPSASTQSEQTMAMNSRTNFIGMWRIQESAISTLNLEVQISLPR